MAMNLATGAMGSLLPKLVELLKDEYKLQKGVKKGIKSLEQEMKSMHAALRKVAEVPRDQLDEQVKLWAGEVRELSFDLEDIVDKFLVRVDDDSDTVTKSNKLKRLTEKMAGLFTKGKARHEIGDAIKEIHMQVQEVAQRRERYHVDNIVAMPAAMLTIDPRLGAMYKEVTDHVGIVGKRDQKLMRLLSDGDSVSKQKLKIVSVVGFGGLGKTTLVKTIYDKIKSDFDCSAFIPVGRNADARKILMDILIDYSTSTKSSSNTRVRSVNQATNQLNNPQGMAMNLATGAMGSLLPKLVELLKDEYKLQKDVKKGIKSLEQEMKSMHAALRKVAKVPRDQLDEQVKLWAGEVRELSFDMEDIVDKFLVRVDDDSDTATKSNKLKRLTKKMAGLFAKGKARHKIACAIKDINMQVQEVAKRRKRYDIDNIVAVPAAMPTIDPRLGALYKDMTDHVGIAGKRDQELLRLLLDGDSVSKQKLKIVSVVGFGGLGKTTLVKTIYDKIKSDFDCRAFIPVGRNADVKKILMDILIDLRMYEPQFTVFDAKQLIDILRESLENKRYLIVIDDIWDEKPWKVINLAFSRSNNFGSRLITTTRIASVSKLCCSSTNDSVYQMEPLSEYDSKRLFYKRIFSNESGCPPEFEEVSRDILNKCGGVPLAIITIAGLLASQCQQVKTVYEWHALHDSIGRGLTEDRSVKEMFRILSFSYYDLPSYLKTCLLYLSMFPEDYKIRKDRLIWMWIAEGFVQCEKSKTSLFEIGETYFYELLNRNMIMPVYDDDDDDDDDDGGRVVACKVHDMVLDLILSLSSEENFVTVVNGTVDSISSQSNIRRLSLQDARKGTPLETPSLLKVRSVASFGDGNIMPSFSRFVVLRVLDLAGCPLGDHNHLNLRDLGSILQLRYLSLESTGISKIPKEFGKLQFLQVLDLRRNYDVELPSTIIKLRRLMCLLIDTDHERLPDGLRNLASMEVLSEIRCGSLSIVEDLGHMEGLRELRIVFDDLSLELQKAFVESLGKLSSIQILISVFRGEDLQSMDLLWERWMPPRSLKIFMCAWIPFPALPAWIRRDPSNMSQLFELEITVKEARQKDLNILGRLPALRTLVSTIQRWSGQLLISADGFRCIVKFALYSKSPGQILFRPGAMPNAETVYLSVGLRVINEEAAHERGGCSDLLGIGNLLSLGRANVWLVRFGVAVEEARQAKTSVENALRAHPNHPGFNTWIYPGIPEDALDDDVLSDPEKEE